MREPIKIDIWSDIACPWCYLGKHRFEAALSQFAQQADAPRVEATYHSYQLSPDLPETFAGSHSDYLASKLGWSAKQIAEADSRMQGLGAQYGLDYNFAANQVANTNKAHQLLHYAKEHGRQEPVKEALFKAHFSDGANIAQLGTLADIAANAGLDRADALRALETGEFAGAVEADKALAARYGITGVPFFVIDGKYGLSGAQEPATFLKALERVAGERPED